MTSNNTDLHQKDRSENPVNKSEDAACHGTAAGKSITPSAGADLKSTAVINWRLSPSLKLTPSPSLPLFRLTRCSFRHLNTTKTLLPLRRQNLRPRLPHSAIKLWLLCGWAALTEIGSQERQTCKNWKFQTGYAGRGPLLKGSDIKVNSLPPASQSFSMLGLVLPPPKESPLFRVLQKARGHFILFVSLQHLCEMLMLTDTCFFQASARLPTRRIKSSCSGRDEKPHLTHHRLQPEALSSSVCSWDQIHDRGEFTNVRYNVQEGSK